MTQAARAQEPSMEEILASIRRIIADDDASKTAGRAPEVAKPEIQAAPPPPPPPPAPPVYAAPLPVVAPQRPSFEPEPEPSISMAGDAIADEASDILDLTESMAAAPPPPAPPPPIAEPAAQFRTIDGSSDLSFDEVKERPVPAPSHGDVERGRLVSSETSAAVDSAFNALAQTVLVQNARTLEDLVREMLRPMLKSWLDDNLPGMVERLVRAEIERVSRGRTG
jgi:cell pole-organizing protein PopZ